LNIELNSNPSSQSGLYLAFGGTGPDYYPNTLQGTPYVSPWGTSYSNTDQLTKIQSATGYTGLGTFNTKGPLTVYLNNNVTASTFGAVTNYAAKSFYVEGDPDTADYQVYFNGSLVSPDPAFSLSAVTDGAYPTGTPFTIFKHRTGTVAYTISDGDWREGFNYIQVKRVVGATTYTTNYIHWVYDSNAASGGWCTILNLSPGVPVFGSQQYISGLEYYTSGYYDATSVLDGYFTGTYQRTGVSLSVSNTGSGTGISVASVPSVDPFSSDPATYPDLIFDTGDIYKNADSIRHTFQTGVSKYLGTEPRSTISAVNAFSVSASSIGPTGPGSVLFYNITPSTALEFGGVTTIQEDFNSETYRLEATDSSGTALAPPTAYTAQSDGSPTGTYVWDESQSLIAAPYTGELAVYDGGLVYPSVIPDFSSVAHKPQISPPVYTGATGTRYYARTFKFTNSTAEFKIIITGTDLDFNESPKRLYGHVIVPYWTAWRDIYESAPGSSTPNAPDLTVTGCKSTYSQSGNVHTFGINLLNQPVPAGGYLVLRITAEPGGYWSSTRKITKIQIAPKV
jgi:hypothetical protein